MLLKAVAPRTNSPFMMEDISSDITRKPLKPGLLTALLTPHRDYKDTSLFSFNVGETTVQLPDGKSFTEIGTVEVEKDRLAKKYFEIPSFNLGYTLTPTDLAGRKKPGSTELMNEEDLIIEMEAKLQLGWELFEELALAELLVNDTNIVRGGPHVQYDFYQELIGEARAPKLDMRLGDVGADHFIRSGEAKDEFEQELRRYGISAERIMVVCGRTYFNARLEIEKQEGISRELSNARDLVSEIVPTMTVGDFNYQMFESHDGLIYVKYSANIIGTKLVADENAYMVPIGITENLIEVVYAPAITRSYVNTTALEMYTWMDSDERAGLTVMNESNRLYANRRPKAIKHLTTSNFPS